MERRADALLVCKLNQGIGGCGIGRTVGVLARCGIGPQQRA